VTNRRAVQVLGGRVGMSRHPTLGWMDAGDPLGLIGFTVMDAVMS